MRPCKLSQRHCAQCFGTSKMADSIPVIGLSVFFSITAFVSLVVVVVVVVVEEEEGEEEEVYRPRLYLLCFQKQKTYASWGRGARQIDRHSPFFQHFWKIMTKLLWILTKFSIYEWIEQEDALHSLVVIIIIIIIVVVVVVFLCKKTQSVSSLGWVLSQADLLLVFLTHALRKLEHISEIIKRQQFCFKDCSIPVTQLQNLYLMTAVRATAWWWNEFFHLRKFMETSTEYLDSRTSSDTM